MRWSLARYVERLRQEIDELIEPLTAEAARVLESDLGADGLTVMAASGFERLRDELNLETVLLPEDDAQLWRGELNLEAARRPVESEASGTAVANDKAGGAAGSRAGFSPVALEATGSAVADDTSDLAAGLAQFHLGCRALRAQDAEHLKTHALVEVVNEVSGETVKVHAPLGEMDVCRAATQKGNRYRNTLRRLSLLEIDYDVEQARCMC